MPAVIRTPRAFNFPYGAKSPHSAHQNKTSLVSRLLDVESIQGNMTGGDYERAT